MHGVVRHDARLCGARDDQHVQADGQGDFAGLGDGDQIALALLDDIFPAFGIGQRLLGRGAANAADQGAADGAKRRGLGAARYLRPGNAARRTARRRANRAVGADQHRARANNHPALHGRCLLGGVGGVGVGGIAFVAPGEGQREKTREQEKGQSKAAQGEVRFFKVSLRVV